VVLVVPALAFVILQQLEVSAWWYGAGFGVWLSWVCVAVLIERPGLRSRQIAARQQEPRRYRDRIGRLLTGLERMVLPDTVATAPRPDGILARLDWLLIPRARDADDLRRLLLRLPSGSWQSPFSLS